MYNSQFCYPPPMPHTAVANPASAAMYLSKILEEEDQLAAEALEQQGSFAFRIHKPCLKTLKLAQVSERISLLFVFAVLFEFTGYRVA